jgi:hypothetical protein
VLAGKRKSESGEWSEEPAMDVMDANIVVVVLVFSRCFGEKAVSSESTPHGRCRREWVGESTQCPGALGGQRQRKRRPWTPVLVERRKERMIQQGTLCVSIDDMHCMKANGHEFN